MCAQTESNNGLKQEPHTLNTNPKTQTSGALGDQIHFW